jgi:hypothetical protein
MRAFPFRSPNLSGHCFDEASMTCDRSRSDLCTFV